MIIYQVKNLVNGKIYVGQTIKTLEIRKKEHLNTSKNIKKIKNRYFYYALNKYGFDLFEWSIIDTAENQDELNNKEKYWINKLYSLVPNGYNMTTGGEFGKMCDEAEKRRVKNSKEVKINLYGKKVININTKEIFRTITEAAIKADITGTAISLCCRGINKKAGDYTYVFLEDYERNSEYYDNYIWENSNSKKVINLSTNEVYESMISAEKETKTPYQMISRCCRKLQKTSNGYFWAYYDEYSNDREYKEYFDKLMKSFTGKEKGVINLDTGEEFDSLAEAGIRYNIDSSAIIRVCKGIKKTCRGYRWAYL